MHAFFAVVGILALALGGIAFAAIKTDIQVGIAVSAFLGGMILIGQAIIMKALRK